CAGEIVVSPCAPWYYAHFLASRPEFSNFKVGRSKLRGITPNFEIKQNQSKHLKISLLFSIYQNIFDYLSNKTYLTNS
ncbi:MAG TPA: hypothetical protein VJA23_04400, partial [Candidatus Nanoarchaeia archaeon]|nr:hypothetical protein [Candidatus Nanoarchaeia archaeon]